MRRLRRVAVSGLGTFVLTVLLPAGPAQAAAPTPFQPGAPLTQAAGVFGAVILFALAVAVLRGRSRPTPTPTPAPGPDPAPDPSMSAESPPTITLLTPSVSAAVPTLADRFSPLRTGTLPARTAVLSRPSGSAAAPRPGARSGRPVERTAPGRSTLVDPYALTAEVRLDGRTVTVSLDGARTDRPGPPHTWYAGSGTFSSATLPLLLGEASGRWLEVDLTRCPDALAIGGPPPQQRWYALRLVRQVIDAGGQVTVVGDLTDDRLPAQCHRVADVFDPRLPYASGIVLAAGLDRRAVQVARQVSVSGGPVPVLLGDAVSTRWSIRIGQPG
ncbi:hypothetical protein ACIBO1_27820 [Micromonospora sp. NPDC049903]|uniref:hypothetical protein n=1 Tax=Micromonospora sp. NPDC049903 TaxID=3364276 RepID=UPI0037A081A5